MLIIQPFIFQNFEDITFGFSTKAGLNRTAPYFFNMSFSVGDNKEKVIENRRAFFNRLNINEDTIAFQKQTHSDNVKIIEEPGFYDNCDGMITNKPELYLAVSSADCCSIFIFDYVKKVIAAVHSGWRGTAKKILSKSIQIMKEEFNCTPENLICYLAPSISQQNYEVGKEVADLFDGKYLKKINDKIYLDVAGANYDILIKHGVKEFNIQKSILCTFEYSEILHSYRRDGKKSGRALGIIGMRVK